MHIYLQVVDVCLWILHCFKKQVGLYFNGTCSHILIKKKSKMEKCNICFIALSTGKTDLISHFAVSLCMRIPNMCALFTAWHVPRPGRKGGHYGFCRPPILLLISSCMQCFVGPGVPAYCKQPTNHDTYKRRHLNVFFIMVFNIFFNSPDFFRCFKTQCIKKNKQKHHFMQMVYTQNTGHW